MKKKKQIFKSYVNFLSKKTKNNLSYDFYIKSIFSFLKFKCFWNFSNFKNYFKSFNETLKKKKDMINLFYSKYNSFY